MEKENYTIVLIPEHKGTTRSFKIAGKWLQLFVFCACIVVVGSIVTGFFSYRYVHASKQVRKKNTAIDSLKRENRQLSQALLHVNKVRAVLSYIENLAKIDKIRSSGSSDEKIVEKLRRMKDSHSVPGSTVHIRYDINRYLEETPNIIPVNGWITEKFSDSLTQSGRAHKAIDIAVATGTPVSAAASGRVEKISRDRYLGLMVELSHGKTFVTRYAHCSRILVSEGEKVKKGQAIALSGNTGHSSGPHLHYEILHNGEPVDPKNYIISYNGDMSD